MCYQYRDSMHSITNSRYDKRAVYKQEIYPLVSICICSIYLYQGASNTTLPASQKVLILLFTMLLQPYLECCVLFWDPQLGKFLKALRCIHRMATKLVNRLERMIHEQHLRTLELSNLEKSRPREAYLALYSFLEKEQRGRCFSLVSGVRT